MSKTGTILLTGATGHLGTTIAARLLAQKNLPPLRLLIRNKDKLRTLASLDPQLAPLLECQCVSGDIRDQVAISSALVDVDTVIHACHSHEYWKGTNYLLDVNVGGARNLLSGIENNSGIRKVIFVGSYSAHDNPSSSQNFQQGCFWSARECSSQSKKMAQGLFLSAAARGHFFLDIISPSYLIGPLQLEPTYFGALFHLALLGPLRWCPPNGINVVDVRDVAKSIVCSVNDSHNNSKRILTSGVNILFRDFFSEINLQAGFTDRPKIIPYSILKTMPKLKQFGSFGKEYFSKNHFVEQCGYNYREFSLKDSIRDSMSWAKKKPLFGDRPEFFRWIKSRYLI